MTIKIATSRFIVLEKKITDDETLCSLFLQSPLSGFALVLFHNPTWFACETLFGFFNGLLHCSAYNLVAITTLRYIAVSDPLKYKTRVTKRRSLIAIAVIWILSISFGVIINIKSEPDSFYGVCRYESFDEAWHLILVTATNSLAPWLIMMVLYVRIILIVNHHLRSKKVSQNQIYPEGEESGIDPRLLKKEIKMTKMVAMILVYYIFAWTPILTYMFVGIHCPTCYFDIYIGGTVRLMLYSNSCINVFIYAGSSSEFKRSFKLLILRMFLCENDGNFEHGQSSQPTNSVR
uniref:Adenosine receptor A1-like n=1 Tax=Saccoglossus kowalevskii TaxID=10224 RepID=A0ABM0M053_SACKO|nr:PREDICTED: adenosine receptor A1-like [Saccoglossus kowalevskii]